MLAEDKSCVSRYLKETQRIYPYTTDTNNICLIFFLSALQVRR